jgi:hypothetical protein
MLFDSSVPYPMPSPSYPDSLSRWFDFFTIPKGVKNFVTTTDPTKDCIVAIDGSYITMQDSGAASSTLSYALDNPPAGSIPESWGADYILYGTITGDATQTMTLSLEAAGSREVVGSSSIPLPKGFDPIVVGQTVAAGIGPIYTAVHKFEASKRDQGEPNAIRPTIELTAASAKLDPGQSTTVTVTMTDCDGVALSQRHLTLSATGGLLDHSDVVTDGQGKASVQFTAGANPVIGSVTTSYQYQTPSGYDEDVTVAPASIQIGKPPSLWFFRGVFTLSNRYTNEQRDLFGRQDNEETTTQKITVMAYLTNVSPIANQFGSFKTGSNVVMRAWGYNTWHTHGAEETKNWEGSYHEGSTTTDASTMTFDVHIIPGSYHVGVAMIKVLPTGSGATTTKTFEPITNTWGTTVDQFSPSLETWSANASGVPRDTTSTTVNVSVIGNTSSTVTSQYGQKFSWANSVMNMTYWSYDNDVESTQSAGLIANSRTAVDHTIAAFLSASGDQTNGILTQPGTVPPAFSLRQNYPNPFNPFTMIEFDLPTQSHVVLRVFTLLGQQVAELVNAQVEPGSHMVAFDGTRLPSGVYVYRIETGSYSETKKCILLR